MKFEVHVDPERAVKLTRFAAISVALAFGLAALVFSGIALLANSRAAGEESLAKSIDLETAEVRKVLDNARATAATRIRSQSKAIADFQQSVSRIAKAKECSVQEFIASTEVQPYLTRFEKQGQVEGWSQIEIQILLVGRGANVVAAMTEMAAQPVPIEFNSVQLQREAVDEEGSKVKAKIQLRVLVQASGAPA